MEGKEEELVEMPGNLIFYECVAIDMELSDVVRVGYLCPRCSES